MSIVDLQKTMLKAVAQALGDDLLSQAVFVGGCTTGLLVTEGIIINIVSSEYFRPAKLED